VRKNERVNGVKWEGDGRVDGEIGVRNNLPYFGKVKKKSCSSK
jgi:hypothetical protein